MSDVSRETMPKKVTLAFGEQYWESFRERGPRHRNVAHWLLDLGWSIREGVMKDYLAPELKGMN